MSAKKQRKLTEAEQRRLDAFNATCDELISQGYRRVSLKVSILKANLVAIAAAVVLFLVALPLFNMLYPDVTPALSIRELIICVIVFLVLIVVHELIHGLAWSFFAPHGFKDVEFGIMRDTFTPYCTCREPLRKGPYIVGALAPLVVLGVIPTVVGFCIGSVAWLDLGLLMIVAAMGDVLIVIKVLRYRPATDDVLLFDHPTEAGSVAFER